MTPIQTPVHDEPTLGAYFAEVVSRLHPAYLEVLALGWRAVPLLLIELQDRRIEWAPAALKAITGISPTPPDVEGGFEAERLAWLAWGRQECWLPDDQPEAIDEAEEIRLCEEAERRVPNRATLDAIIARQKASPSKNDYHAEDNELPC